MNYHLKAHAERLFLDTVTYSLSVYRYSEMPEMGQFIKKAPSLHGGRQTGKMVEFCGLLSKGLNPLVKDNPL